MTSVDVVVPCYNYGRFLRESVGSVLSQNGVELRVLIIDNASDDDSLAVAQSLAAEDPRVEVIAHAQNRGPTFSYNEGVDWASSDCFLILDADDLLAPGALKRAAALLESRPDIVFTHGIEGRLETDGTKSTFIPPSGPEWCAATGIEFIRRLCERPINSIGANTVVRRTWAQKQAGYYRACLPYTDDLDMWLRLAMLGGVANIRTVQAVRRYHPERMSVHYQDVQVRDFREREAAFECFFGDQGGALADADELLASARRGLGEHAYWSAVSHFARGHRQTAAELFRLSAGWRRYSALPPFGWLAKMDQPFERTAQVIRDTVRGRRMRERLQAPNG
jgi:glycosyltransferase involved in cell wall biosynthesis